MKGFKDVTIQEARPLPVVILADTSGSMKEDGKIEALNLALGEMIRSLGMQSRVSAEIWVAIIVFGGTAVVHSEFKPAYQYEEIPTFSAGGGTPFGQVLNITQQILEDEDKLPIRSYNPTIVVISDGRPTDAWEPALDAFLASKRASDATRLAIGIGPDKVEEVLSRFINDPEIPVIYGKDARDIEKFIRCVSKSVSSRSVQSNPNNISQSEIKELFREEDLDF
jgi:uncharacterized protein YegL